MHSRLHNAGGPEAEGSHHASRIHPQCVACIHVTHIHRKWPCKSSFVRILLITACNMCSCSFRTGRPSCHEDYSIHTCFMN